ncbi:MAG: MerR family transcriptional regulator [Magnetococcales bacterium]|nr:MerR family transcriptional regulator [Magnetococcales bacterium]
MKTLSAILTIRQIAQSLNVPVATVRTWERRYGLFSPFRTVPGGHRRYTAMDLEKAQQLRTLLDQEVPIKQAASQLTIGKYNAESTSLDQLFKAAVQAVSGFDMTELECIFQRALILYPPDTVMMRLIVPLFRYLDSRWDSHPQGIAEEHFASNYFHIKLSVKLNHAMFSAQVKKKKVLVACLPGEQHDLGLLLFSLVLIEHEIWPIYLGADLPLEQIESVFRTIKFRNRSDQKRWCQALTR